MNRKNNFEIMHNGTLIQGNFREIIDYMLELDFEMEDIINRFTQAMQDHTFILNTENGDTVVHVDNGNRGEKFFSCETDNTDWKEITELEYSKLMVTGERNVYELTREEVQEQAIEWSHEDHDWNDSYHINTARFEVLGASFDLTEEFKENAII